MKKIISLILFFCCILNIIPICADEIESDVTEHDLIKLGILDEDSFLNDDTITREECLIAIMRTIGATDEEIGLLGSCSFYGFADTPSRSYIGCAYLAKIAHGEKCIIDYPTYRTEHSKKNIDYFFFPNRTVTIKECLAFMIKCLQCEKIDFDLTIERANEYGLINVHDNFIQNPNFGINQDDFLVLIERMLQQKRYKYYGRENNVFKMEGNVDEERTISYYDMLKQRM